MNEALTVLIWVVSIVIGLPFVTFCVCVTIGLVIGLSDMAKEKKEKRHEQ